MANQKISALTALTGANTEQLADVLPIVDNSASQTKKILVSELAQAMLVLGTEQATTSGTSWDFTIPAWAKRITLNLAGFSTNGTSNPLIQIGDSGGIETSGYLGASSILSEVGVNCANYTTGFGIFADSASNVIHGSIVLTLENASSFTWICSGVVALSNTTRTYITAGRKSLSAALTTIRLTTVNGSDAGDAGAVNVLYE